MANLPIKDGAGASKYLKATGDGTDGDAHIPQHLETNSATIVANQTTMIGHLDGVEGSLTTITGHVDGIETLIGTTNTTLTTIDGRVDGLEGQIGIVTETAPASDTASSGLNGRLQRIAQRLTSLIALLPTALTGSGNFKTAVNEIALPTTIYNGNTNVTTAGTRVTLASSQAILSGVTIKAKTANTGIIYVGSSTVSSSNGYQLAAGEQVFLEIANLNTVNLDSSVSGEGVTYLAS